MDNLLVSNTTTKCASARKNLRPSAHPCERRPCRVPPNLIKHHTLGLPRTPSVPDVYCPYKLDLRLQLQMGPRRIVDCGCNIASRFTTILSRLH